LEAKILERIEYPLWNEFVNNSKFATLLSFWQWGEAQKGNKERFEIVTVQQSDEIVLGALCMIKSVKGLGNILYIPYGPNFLDKKSLIDGFGLFKSKVIELAKTKNCFAIEIEPFYGNFVDERNISSKNLQTVSDKSIYKELSKNGFKSTGKNFQAKYKLLYDLLVSEDELLTLMKKKTRYNVRLAEKKGIEIKYFYPDDPDITKKIKTFYKLLLEMQSHAGGYPIRSYEFFVELFNLFKGTKDICLIEASYEGQTAAMNISEFTNSWASSFYAASNRDLGKFKAPYLLRWAAVKLAKSRGIKIYDFWGIVPKSKDHAGYSDIKVRFGGYRFDTTGIWALPMNKLKYFVYKKILPVKVKIANIVRKIIKNKV